MKPPGNGEASVWHRAMHTQRDTRPKANGSIGVTEGLVKTKKQIAGNERQALPSSQKTPVRPACRTGWRRRLVRANCVSSVAFGRKVAVQNRRASAEPEEGLPRRKSPQCESLGSGESAL